MVASSGNAGRSGNNGSSSIDGCSGSGGNDCDHIQIYWARYNYCDRQV